MHTKSKSKLDQAFKACIHSPKVSDKYLISGLVVMGAEGDPPDPRDEGGGDKGVAEETLEIQEIMDVTEQEQGGVNNDRALVAVESQDKSWASVAATDAEEDVIRDVLRIVLKKTDKSASFFLSDKQKGKLVFQQLDIPKEKVIGIDMEDFRTIRVHMNTWAEPWKIAYSIQVKDGLVTLPMRMFRRNTKVRIQRAGVGTSKTEITEMLSHFGTIEEDVHWCTYFEDHPHPNTLSEEERMMRGIKNGEATVRMFISKPIPSFGLLPNGRKVRVKYNAQPTTCARCHQGIRGCKGNANAAKCERAGGQSVPLAEYWAILTAETEVQREEGVETAEIPGNVLLVEGLGKEAGIDWLKQFLGAGGMTATIESGQLRRSKDKNTWEITGLSPAEIRDALEGCSGTQYKGRTVYCTPVVANGNSLFETQSESGQSEDDDANKENDDNGNNDDEKNDGKKDDDDDSPLPPVGETPKKTDEFQTVESKSAEKKRKKEERQAKAKADKEAELAYAKKHGLVNSEGDHKSPPKHKSKGKTAAKRSSKEAGLSPTSNPPKTRQTRERTASQRLPSQTSPDSAAASQ